MKGIYLKTTVLIFFVLCQATIKFVDAQNVKLTEAVWHGTGCFKIEMPMGTVYFEKDNGVSGFKSFIDLEGNDWIASYLEPGPNGDYRGFPNSVGNFGHAGRNSGSTTTIVDGKTEGEPVILESTNEKFTFQYWFFSDRVVIKVLKSEGEYNFLFEGVVGGTADAEDYFVTADGEKHIPTIEGEFDDFTPEWIYLGDPKAKQVLFLAKTPDDDAPNENHRQIRKGNLHNMDLYSFGRTGKEHDYKVYGMSGNEHICIIGFAPVTSTHNEISAMIDNFLTKPFTKTVKPEKKWSNKVLDHDGAWFASDDARTIANSVLQYQSPQGGWPKSTNLAMPPLELNNIPHDGDGRANSLDNNATTLPMEFIARVYQGSKDEKLKTSFIKGLDYLLKAQYPNGGWPQFWPLRGDKYYSHITFNDGAMINVMKLLQAVAAGTEPYSFVDSERQALAASAVKLGIDCILKSQIKQKGALTVWCAQHDENTLEPAWARAYEPPSLSGSESVGIVRFLMSVENPTPEIINAVEGAVSWLRSVAITDQRLDKVPNPDGRTDCLLVNDPDAPLLWSRFYELETNRPLYLDRDSKFRYNFSEISYERRSGYSYHGYWATDLLIHDYPLWLAKYALSSQPKPLLVIEAETGKFTGWVDKHSCWHNIMLSNAPHSTHSGRGAVDTKNEIGSYIEVKYNATWTGPHQITVRYTHIKSDPRPGELLINGKAEGKFTMPQSEALPAWKTQSLVTNLNAGQNIIRLRALNEGGLPNMDYIKVAEVRKIETGSLPNIQILEAEDGSFTGKEDHHSCWNYIAQIQAAHSGFTGEGYVDADNKIGSYIEVEFDFPEAGEYWLGIRYVHGKSDIRKAELLINNEVSNPSLAFTSTDTWTTWTTISTPVKLQAGKNVIRLNATGAQGLANIDHFAILPAL